MARRQVTPHYNTGQIVLTAVKKLMQNTGWTSRTIIKFIKMEYNLHDPSMGRKVSRALKRGVKLGMLIVNRGRYRLNDISRLARPIGGKEVTRLQRRQREARPLRMSSPAPSY